MFALLLATVVDVYVRSLEEIIVDLVVQHQLQSRRCRHY